MEALNQEEFRNAEAVYRDIQEQYRRAINNVQSDIEIWYQRLADNNDISYSSAKKLLKANELEEFKWTVEQYIKVGKESNVNGKWLKKLENASARYHISRLEALKIQMQQHAEYLSAQLEGSTTEYLQKAYGRQYYRTAYELALGTGVGSNLAVLGTSTINLVLAKPWAQDGKTFSSRIWDNKEKLVRNLHTELTQCIIRGEAPKKAIDRLAKVMNVSRSQAGALIMTETAAISAAAQERCYKDLDVEEFEVVETLDKHTCEICQDMDGKHYPISDYRIGETAPPFHPRCRGCTCPYFDDEFSSGGQRAARDPDTGDTYYVPADMTYKEWKRTYVMDAEQLEIGESGNVESLRKGDNIVNLKEISSESYRRKFNQVTSNSSVNDALRRYASAMLTHRNASDGEDLYILSSKTGKRLFSSTTGSNELGVSLTTDEIAKIKQYANIEGIIAMHNHPTNLLPTGSDFVSAGARNYDFGVVVTHDGRVFAYRAGNKPFRSEYLDKTVDKYVSAPYNYDIEEAQIKALTEFEKEYGIEWKELK